MEMIDFELPNGQVIKIPADTSDEKKQEIIENITTNSNVKAEEAKQAEETGDAGLIGNWRPEGSATSWLFDNAVVAPYEGARKFLNSTSSLVEGLGDTLGEKTNLGGFRYGGEASNGMMEYVPYDEAIKLGNVKGILDIGSKLFSNFDETDKKYLEKVCNLISKKYWP